MTMEKVPEIEGLGQNENESSFANLSDDMMDVFDVGDDTDDDNEDVVLLENQREQKRRKKKRSRSHRVVKVRVSNQGDGKINPTELERVVKTWKNRQIASSTSSRDKGPKSILKTAAKGSSKRPILPRYRSEESLVSVPEVLAVPHSPGMQSQISAISLDSLGMKETSPEEIIVRSTTRWSSFVEKDAPDSDTKPAFRPPVLPRRTPASPFASPSHSKSCGVGSYGSISVLDVDSELGKSPSATNTTRKKQVLKKVGITPGMVEQLESLGFVISGTP